MKVVLESRKPAKERREAAPPQWNQWFGDSVKHVHLWRLWKCGATACIYSGSFYFAHITSSGLSGSEGTITSHLNALELGLTFLWARSLLLCLSTSAAIWPYFSLLCFPNGLHMGHTHNVVSQNQPFPLIFSAYAPQRMTFSSSFAFCRPDIYSI